MPASRAGRATRAPAIQGQAIQTAGARRVARARRIGQRDRVRIAGSDRGIHQQCVQTDSLEIVPEMVQETIKVVPRTRRGTVAELRRGTVVETLPGTVAETRRAIDLETRAATVVATLRGTVQEWEGQRRAGPYR